MIKRNHIISSSHLIISYLVASHLITHPLHCRGEFLYWGLLGRSWGFLGSSWGLLGRAWGSLQRALGGLGRSWGGLGRPWGCLRWMVLRRSWGGLGVVLVGLGAILDRSCAILAGLGAILNQLGEPTTLIFLLCFV